MFREMPDLGMLLLWVHFDQRLPLKPDKNKSCTLRRFDGSYRIKMWSLASLKSALGTEVRKY